MNLVPFNRTIDLVLILYIHLQLIRFAPGIIRTRSQVWVRWNAASFSFITCCHSGDLTASEYALGYFRELIAETNTENSGEYVVAKVQYQAGG